MSLSFREFHHLNNLRKESAPVQGTELDWNLTDWTNELCGEAGELANLAKKVRRARPTDPTLEDSKEKLGHEIADVVICASLVAGYLGIDFEQAVRDKFNIVSERMKSDLRV